jgi:hypothetical protein
LLARCIQDVMLALDYNTYDMFSRGPMADMMEYQALNRKLPHCFEMDDQRAVSCCASPLALH